MSDDDMLTDHRRTYESFVKGTVYSIIAIVIVLAGMAYFLT